MKRRDNYVFINSITVDLPQLATQEEVVRALKATATRLRRTSPDGANTVVLFEFPGPNRARQAIPIDQQGRLQLCEDGPRGDAEQRDTAADENRKLAEAEARRITQKSARALDIGIELARTISESQLNLDMFEDIASRSPDQPATIRAYLDTSRNPQSIIYPDQNRRVGGGGPIPNLLVSDQEIAIRCMVVTLENGTFHIATENLPREVASRYRFADREIQLLAHGRAADILRAAVGSRVEVDIIGKPAERFFSNGHGIYCLILVRLCDPGSVLREISEYLLACQQGLPE